jgi:hypothetical protein
MVSTHKLIDDRYNSFAYEVSIERLKYKQNQYNNSTDEHLQALSPYLSLIQAQYSKI